MQIRTTRSGKNVPGVRYRPRAALRSRSRGKDGTRRTVISAQLENTQPEIPRVRKRQTQTLMLAIRYFHLLLGSFLSSQSVNMRVRRRTVAATVAAPSTGILASLKTRA